MTSAALLSGMPSSSETACRGVEGPAVDRVTKIFNGAIEDAALDKRDGAQRAVAGRMAGQFGEAVFDCAERDAFAGLVGVGRRCRGAIRSASCSRTVVSVR